tara:strand:+ start:79 stop:615 length:537 start_codon:yes stop_codon:yes gene_type:complete
MGAGILPVALYRGSLMVLLGQERHNNLWCDFGGSPLPQERKNQYITAIREGAEELNGLFGDKDDLKIIVDDKLICGIKNYDDKYTSFLFNLQYDKNLEIYFENQNKFIESHLQNEIVKHNGLFEKKKITWYNIVELEEKLNSNNFIRPHYYIILKYIVDNNKAITNSVINMNKIENKS